MLAHFGTSPRLLTSHEGIFICPSSVFIRPSGFFSSPPGFFNFQLVPQAATFLRIPFSHLAASNLVFLEGFHCRMER